MGIFGLILTLATLASLLKMFIEEYYGYKEAVKEYKRLLNS